MKIKEIEFRFLTFEEQCMYELVMDNNNNNMYDEFIDECKRRFKDAGIIEICNYEGEYVHDIYYNKCKIEHIREATPNEKFAYYYLQMFNTACEQRPCVTCIFDTKCIQLHDNVIRSRELLENKTIIVDGGEYDY